MRCPKCGYSFVVKPPQQYALQSYPPSEESQSHSQHNHTDSADDTDDTKSIGAPQANPDAPQQSPITHTALGNATTMLSIDSVELSKPLHSDPTEHHQQRVNEAELPARREEPQPYDDAELPVTANSVTRSRSAYAENNLEGSFEVLDLPTTASQSYPSHLDKRDEVELPLESNPPAVAVSAESSIHRTNETRTSDLLPDPVKTKQPIDTTNDEGKTDVSRGSQPLAGSDDLTEPFGNISDFSSNSTSLEQKDLKEISTSAHTSKIRFGELNLEQEHCDDETTADALPLQQSNASPESFDSTRLLPNVKASDTQLQSISLANLPDAAQSSVRCSPPPLSLKYPRKSKVLSATLAIVLALLVVGLGLAATPWGAFGYHFVSDKISAKSHAALLEDTVRRARAKLISDAANQTLEAIAQTDKAIAQAPRMADLSAFGAWLGYQYELRFGADATVHAHANALLAAALQHGDNNVRYLDIAKATKAAAEGEIAKARQLVQTLSHMLAKNIDVTIVEAEVQLIAQEFKDAERAWQHAKQLESSARTWFGIARLDYRTHRSDKAREAANETLKYSPNHVGARILLAQIDIDENQRDRAINQLRSIVSSENNRAIYQTASTHELVTAWSMLGALHLQRSHMTSAEQAFSEAIKIDSSSAAALVGLGDVLYQEGRYAEALNCYENAVQSNARSIDARLGTVKASVALERLEDADNTLLSLRKESPNHPQVALWAATVQFGLGNQQEAEKILTQTLEHAPNSAENLAVYIALAEHLMTQGKTEQANQKLKDAESILPDSIDMNLSFGRFALKAGRLQQAKLHFEKAVQKDPLHLASLFDLGVTFRRMGQYDKASELLEKIAETDKRYPGLALEKGLLFEATGQSQRAVEMYQEALAKAPNDPDLMLRIGSTEVTAGRTLQAETMLRNVLRLRPNSAEANHYLGRACLVKGINLAEALRYLQRATQIDPHRASYWLYVGWAANETGQPAIAQEALKKALDLDQGLADAYWQRGVLLRKQGAIVDAEKDLIKALELNPSRFESYATLAECYEDQSAWKKALNAWKKAIAADGNRAYWRYKLGRLHYHAHRREAAAEQLTQALVLSTNETRPLWLWEANLMLADISRLSAKRKEAIMYYRAFLKLAPSDNPFRDDAIKHLTAYGASIEDR